uniref:NADH-ubiquinone oxidoreductase chain 4 n=1 Tax=Myrmecocephalus concinnus TaxID=1143072 RepID=A0A0S2M7R8_9COLE|nr:NADH dehydrogenase subunit 4 [Myrmecocephalus concinnus]ALO70714.1 NADH deshydrogenase subunit 4 [Myrmecocephalus concinnus]
MMKFIFMLIMMIPLSFLKEKNWLNQYLYFLMSSIILVNIKFNYLMGSISYMFMYDMLSYLMILLSFWICSLMILASSKIFKKNNHNNLFFMIMLFLLLALMLTFSVSNLFLFYLFFEMSLIPTLMLIIGWGYQPERIQAGKYLMFYTLFASLPMMMFMFYYEMLNYSLVFFMFFIKIDSFMLFFFMNFVFLVKMPMYFVHLWLPKAHVEAPVSGSMILAGVMLKLGGYGMFRVMKIFSVMINQVNYLLIVISLIGGVIVSLICLRQSDMKSLIAYSSVSHMGLVLAGIMTMNHWGLMGSLGMMLAHGLCSSGLFCLANICYERMSSRSLYLNKGLMNLMPSMSLWWFLLCSSNMAAPPSYNLLGEIMLINSLVSWNFYLMIFIMLMSFFSAVYSLYLYSYSQHGMLYSGLYSFFNGNNREYLLLMLHWLPLNLMILKSEIFFMWL